MLIKVRQQTYPLANHSQDKAAERKQKKVPNSMKWSSYINRHIQWDLTYLSNSPWSVGIHRRVGPPCEWEFAWNFFLNMGRIPLCVKRLDVNTLMNFRSDSLEFL